MTINREVIQIPELFKKKLNETDLGNIHSVALKAGKIYNDNKLYFFPEYTNHGISHIEEVLQASSELISDGSYEFLTSKDFLVIILSVILHDLGMHITKDSLIRLIENENNIIAEGFDHKTWKEEWQEFFHEAKRFNEVKLEQIFGNKSTKIDPYDFVNNEEYSRKLLGEFLRRMHPRLAHEISIKGYPTVEESNFINLSDEIDISLKNLSGLVARSHGLELRETFKYLKEKYSQSWSNPYNTKVIFHMSILRIADYIQIHKDRADKLILQTRRLSSPVSKQEWEKHNAIEFISTDTDDPEKIYVHALPKTSTIFLELQKLFNGIQYELDISWAVLGEVYGRHNNFSKLGIKFRRIQSNIDESEDFQKTVKYIPEKVVFDADPAILKLLIGPLYGEDPKYGIRELLQNSIDATKEREYLEKDNSNSYIPKVYIDIKESDEGKYILTLRDNGIGMNKDTLINYFFRAGASFRKSDFWLKQFGVEGNAKIERVGRFGVGVLAAYLLGDEISVTTRHAHTNEGLFFEAKLTSTQIELVKVQCDIGTKIEISIKKEVTDLFLKEELLDWFTWYLLEKPKIEYSISEKIKNKFLFINNDGFTPCMDETNSKWRVFESEFYGKVMWSFKKAKEERYFDFEDVKRDSNLLAINGFKIPEAYSLVNTKYNWQKPIVSVFDLNGTMPLSLNRNYLQNDILPFEKELLENISKDIIGKLLSLKINRSGSFYYVSRANSILQYELFIDLQPNIIFFNNSFTLDIPYILNALNINLIPIIWIKKTEPKTITHAFKNGYISVISNLSSIASFSNEMDNYYHGNPYNNWFSIFGSRKNRLVTWKREFLKKDKHKYLMYGSRLRLGFKSDITIDIESDKIVSFLVKKPYYTDNSIQPKIKGNASDSSVIINELENIESEFDLIVENEFGYYEDENDKDYDSNKEGVTLKFNPEYASHFNIFEDMLKKYFGKDYLIPIDYEERKIKFPEAFEDLASQIAFHNRE